MKTDNVRLSGSHERTTVVVFEMTGRLCIFTVAAVFAVCRCGGKVGRQRILTAEFVMPQICLQRCDEIKTRSHRSDDRTQLDSTNNSRFATTNIGPTQLNEHPYGRRCKHLNVRIYLT